jgi:hypothetical protein
MRNKIIAAGVFAAALLAATSASAAGVGIYYLSDLGMSCAAFIKTFGTKANAKAAQDEIANSPEAQAALAAQGISLKNVILAKDAADGSRIYYVK